MDRSRKTLQVVGTIVAVVAVLYILMLSLQPAPRPAPLAVASAQPGAPNAPNAPYAPPPGAAGTPGLTPEEDKILENALEDPSSLREQLSHYLLANRYSPTTLRITPEMKDVLKPNAPVITIAAAPNAAKSKDPEDHAFAAVEPDTGRFAATEKLGVTFRTFLGREAQTPTAAVIKKAYAARVGSKGLEPVATLDFKGPAGAMRAVFDPSALAAEAWSGYLHLIVEWQLPNGHPDKASATVQYTGVVPAKFTGVFRDRLEKGSIIVTAELEVEKPGRYDLTALIFEPGAEMPIAQARFQGDLEAGKQEAPFEFYGLVFHDQKAKSGTFEVRTVAGTLMAPPGVETRGLEMKIWDGPYVTRAYNISDLTSEEWTSPQKKLIVESMQNDIAALEAKQKTAP